MSTIGYKKFGKFLLDTYDLDPLYVILAMTNWPEKLMYRFLLGYWVYYSAGVACKLAESKNFYQEMVYGDQQHWPRGHERRHMRGANFLNTVSGLKRYGEPEQVVAAMVKGKDFQTIGKHVQQFHGFGQWIAWKVADMVERVLQQPVSFDDADIAVYKDPVKGAALIGYGDQHYPITKTQVKQVFDYLEVDFGAYKAPPYLDRRINIQEMETVACKYKAYINGHYPLGLDTFDIYHGLRGWGDLAQELSRYLKPYVRNLEANYEIKI